MNTEIKNESKVKNLGIKLDINWINNVNIDQYLIEKCVKEQIDSKKITIDSNYEIAWLIKAVTFIDLTTLGGDDTASNVTRLCMKALNPLKKDFLDELYYIDKESLPITTAAVCLYPNKLTAAVDVLKNIKLKNNLKLASVATGFPSGQYPLKTRLEEIRLAIELGAREIDIVIDRSLVLTEQWEKLYDEIKQMRNACGPDVHLKTILAVGELDNFENIYKSSLVAMMAGSDFIKTSTGKETVNATLPIGMVMCRAIMDYYKKTGFKVGLKPAGGIRTSNDAINWLILVKKELDESWLNNDYFRIGASSLLTEIEKRIYFLWKNYLIPEYCY